MNTTDYNAKMEDILSDAETYQELSSNPLNSHNNFFRKEVRRIAYLGLPPDLTKRFQPNNGSLPYIYGIPKLHKVGIPLRPIISNVGAVSRPVAGWLAGLLTPYLGKFSKAH